MSKKTIEVKKKPIRIIFLDIEGVLSTNRVQFSKLERGVLEDYDPIVVDFLDKVCIKYLCHIVITSRGRKLVDEIDWFKSRMVQHNGGMLADFLFPDEELWRTTTATLECKALEIDNWFVEFHEKYKDRFYIDNYLIIDDNGLGSISMHDNHFVYVNNGFDGMGCEEFRNVLKILDKSGEKMA